MIKINPKLFADTIYPIGSIVIKADNADYSNWLGFTWERTLVGRVAVGIDTTQTEFDTIGETGGNKEHKHRLPLFQPNANGTDGPRYVNWNGANYGISQTAVAIQNGAYGDLNPVGYSGTANAYPMLSDNESSLQPYQVVAFWKRTA